MVLPHQAFFIFGVVASRVLNSDAGDPHNMTADCKIELLDPNQKVEECCQFPKQTEDPKAFAFLNQCYLEITKSDSANGEQSSSQSPEDIMSCMTECLFKKLNLLTPALTLKKKPTKKTLYSMYSGSPAFTSATRKAVNICMKNPQLLVRPAAKCLSGAYEVKVCVLRETFKACPKSAWKDSEFCRKEKELIERCPDAIPIASIPHQR